MIKGLSAVSVWSADLTIATLKDPEGNLVQLLQPRP
jgi:hypothetical protein